MVEYRPTPTTPTSLLIVLDLPGYGSGWQWSCSTIPFYLEQPSLVSLLFLFPGFMDTKFWSTLQHAHTNMCTKFWAKFFTYVQNKFSLIIKPEKFTFTPGAG